MDSPRLSFKGYKFGEALYRNKDSLKGLVALVGTVNMATGFDWKMFGMTLGGAVLALAIKLVLDAIDFYFSVVKVDK